MVLNRYSYRWGRILLPPLTARIRKTEKNFVLSQIMRIFATNNLLVLRTLNLNANMISKTIARYVWLLNTLIEEKSLTFEEIDLFSGKKPYPLRSFHEHRKGIKELFGIDIKCTTRKPYRYYIANPEALNTDKTRKWLLESFAMMGRLEDGYTLRDRIVFEEYAKKTLANLELFIKAMKVNNEVELDYYPFDKPMETFHLHPYAMKVYNRRWYVAGYIKEKEAIRSIALDRIGEISITKNTFEMPDDFSAHKFFANTIGIFTNEQLQPKKVRLRVGAKAVEYFRSSPLHKSQEEVVTKYNEYSDFQYRLCLTPELTTAILSYADLVEVLEPQELRDEIKGRIEKCLTKYK